MPPDGRQHPSLPSTAPGRQWEGRGTCLRTGSAEMAASSEEKRGKQIRPMAFRHFWIDLPVNIVSVMKRGFWKWCVLPSRPSPWRS